MADEHTRAFLCFYGGIIHILKLNVMTINIGKKQLIIGVVAIAVIIVGVFGVSALKNSAYEKNAKQMQRNIHELYYTSSILSSEIHTTWRDYIMDDKEYMDKVTGKFYEDSWGVPNEYKWCSSFSVAIAEKQGYYEDKGVQDSLDSLYSATKALLTEMTPAPDKFKDFHSDLSELFHTAEAMYNCAVDPDGNLQSYTNEINTLTSDYKKQSSNIDILIGEIDEVEKSKLELDALMKFF